MTRQVSVAATLVAAERAALEHAAAVAGDHPGAVLYLAPRERPTDEVQQRWNEIGAPIRLRTETFDSVVADAIEQQSFETHARGLSGEQRQRVVEAVVDSLDQHEHPLAPREGMAGAPACAEAEDLLSLLEFAGVGDPEALQADDRLSDVDSQVRAAIEALSSGFDQERDRFSVDGSPKTLLSERYQRVCDSREGLEAVLEPVDAVVLGPFAFFSVLEAEFVDAVAATVQDTTAALPLAGADAPIRPALDITLEGVDQGAARAWERYAELGFSVAPNSPAEPSPGEAIGAALYRYETDQTIEESTLAAAGVEWHAYPTPAHETRGMARAVREAVAAGHDLDQIGVVATNLPERRRELFEVFDQYGIPVQDSEQVALGETDVGSVVANSIRIGDGEGRVQDALRLADNPVTAPAWPGTTVTAAELATISDTVEATSLDAACRLLERGDQEGIAESLRWLEATCEELSTADPAAARAETFALLEALGVVTQGKDDDGWEVQDDADRPAWARDREQAALHGLDDVLESIVDTAQGTEHRTGDRLARALSAASVDATIGKRDSIALCSLTDVFQREFDVVVVGGLTAEAFPSVPARLAFTREINEAHRDFDPSDATLRARYALGLLPAAVDRLVLTHPDQTPEGEEAVIADFLAELQRICTDELTPTYRDDGARYHSREDIQRQVGSVLDAQTQPPLDVATAAIESGAFDEGPGGPGERLQAGVECAAARRTVATTPYDGLLSAETVSEFQASERPLSPSRINTYAKCGFKYYANYLLGFETPDQITLEADRGLQGYFIHETVARFLTSLQQKPGDPVSITDPEAHHDDLFEAVQKELGRSYIDQYESVFHNGWLTRLLAGLEPSSYENPYAGPPEHRGLFVRFLESLAAEQENMTTRPAFFEAGIGVDRRSDVTTILSESPVELIDGVEIRGRVDRVDIVPDTSPTAFTAIDYKTGGSPSVADMVQGLDFQLPLYLRMLAAALGEDGWDPVGAAYYDLSAPTKAQIQKSPLSSGEYSEHYRSGGGAVLDSNDPPFENHEGVDSFKSFLTETIDQRLETVRDASEAGVFHPTVLEAGEAKCEYCDFAHVCDVRHHRRAERLRGHGLETVYIPPGAHAEPEVSR